jgi:Ca-activated chloride channel family protein
MLRDTSERRAEEPVKRLTLGLALFAGLAVSISAQQPNSDQTPVFRTDTNIVSLNVTVLDPKKQFVGGLTQQDFSVYEDGVQQQLRFFESRTVPLDLILLIDTSSSMHDKMTIVHDAAVGFLKSMKEGDRGAVVAFNDRVDVLQPLTADGAALEQAIRGTSAKGSTSLNNALYIALKQFGRNATGSDADLRRQAIAVLSDGEDTSSLISFDEVLALARKSGVSIYTIGLHTKYENGRSGAPVTPRYFSTADFSMKSLAQETGAQAFFPLQVGELKGIYASIAQELASQYSLAYSPANPRSDGRYRRIVVRVASRPELQLRTRSGYTAEPIASASFPQQQ